MSVYSVMTRSRWVNVSVVALCALLLSCSVSLGDEEKDKKEIGKWYPSLEAGVTGAQSAYSDNWSGGDRGSIVWTAIANGTLERQFSKGVNWQNALKLAYGQTIKQSVNESGNRHWDQPEKSTDLIDLESILRLTQGWFVDPYASGRLETQFEDLTDPAGRTIRFNPIKLKVSTGMAKKFLDTKKRSLLTRLGFTIRQTNRRIFSMPSPSKTTNSESATDGGIEFIADYKAQVLEDRVTWTSKLSALQPLFYSKQSAFDDLTPIQLSDAGLPSDISDYPGVFDLDWENIFSTQITKIISVNLYLRWVYDKYDNSAPPVLSADGTTISNATGMHTAIRKAGQFKQTLSIGITYRIL